MDGAQLAETLADLQRKEGEETRNLEDKIDRARRVIERCEKRLRTIHSKYDQQYQSLLEEFRGRRSPPEGSSSLTEGLPRVRRGSLDQPLLEFLREWQVGVFTVPMVAEEWNRLHPQEQAQRTTIRGVLDRLAGEHLEVVNAGGKGSENPRQYRLRESKNVVRMAGIGK
jgi:hypothetical protein